MKNYLKNFHVAKKDIPNYLTYTRFLLIPAIIYAFFQGGEFGNILAAHLFLIAALTDFLDGYLARKWKVISKRGAAMDHISDKLLVASCLLLVLEAGRVDSIAVMIIVCRELLISGFREALVDKKIEMPVTNLAKYKTTFQMMSVYFLLLDFYLGGLLIWVAVILTLLTSFDYFRKAARALFSE